MALLMSSTSIIITANKVIGCKLHKENEYSWHYQATQTFIISRVINSNFVKALNRTSSNRIINLPQSNTIFMHILIRITCNWYLYIQTHIKKPLIPHNMHTLRTLLACVTYVNAHTSQATCSSHNVLSNMLGFDYP